MKIFILFFCVTLLQQTVLPTSTPCKLYPKIFGGSSGNTDSQAMDANLDKDIIVSTGWTYDDGLTGISLSGGAVPFLTAYSISTA